MNIGTIPFFVVLGFLFLTQTTGFAQDANIELINERELAIEDLKPEDPYDASEKALTMPYRYHKRMHARYNGYAIEIATSFRPLQRDFHLFKNFGNVHYLKNKDGKYSYMILLDFYKEKAVKKYLETIILPNCPQARAFRFKYGEAKLIK